MIVIGKGKRCTSSWIFETWLCLVTFSKISLVFFLQLLVKSFSIIIIIIVIIINILIIIHLNFFIFSFIIVGYVIVFYFITIYLFIFLSFSFIHFSFWIHFCSILLHLFPLLTFFVSLISWFQLGHLRSRSAPGHLHLIISNVVIPTGLKILREEHLDHLKYRENSVAFVLLLCQLQFYGLVNVAGFGWRLN